jgi:hypothetical protein
MRWVSWYLGPGHSPAPWQTSCWSRVVGEAVDSRLSSEHSQMEPTQTMSYWPASGGLNYGGSMKERSAAG